MQVNRSNSALRRSGPSSTIWHKRRAVRPSILDLVFIAGLGLAPMVASAVGFGKLSVDSAIGEPLSVRVPLVSVQPGDLEELGVSLAAPGWYEASGLEYPDIASELVLDLDLSDPAEPVVTVKTVNGVDNVAIPIMLELEWPQRIMRRQVTVLLNPPGYQPLRDAASTDQAGRNSVEASGTIGVASAGISQPRETVETAIGKPDRGTAAPSTSRPTVMFVESGDSLSTIVDRYLPDGATRFQGRMAFYDVNGEAFRDGDINQIIRGAELTVPTVETILELPVAESRRRYADLLSAAHGDGQTNSQQSSPGAGSDSRSSAALSNSGTATDGFRLSLLEVEEPGLLEQQGSEAADDQVESGAGIAQSGQGSNQLSAVNAISADVGAAQDTDGSPSGPAADDFAMQGFSMKLTVMNAYIVELQDENRQLRNRVSSLENKVEQLILRSGQPTVSLVGEQTADQDVAIGVSTGAGIDDDQAFLLEPAMAALDNAADEGGAPVPDAQSGAAVESPATANQQSTTVDSEMSIQEATVIADSGDAGQVATAEGPGVETTSPQLVYRDSLLQQASNLVQRFNTPLVQLLVAVVAMGLGLLLWMLFRDRKRYRLVNEFADDQRSRGDDQDYDMDYDEEVGVSYASGDEVTQLDLDDDEPLVYPAEVVESDLGNLPESNVDLITQSEVYLTYDRPVQAVEVLLEEYGKNDSDKFVVATRILRILEDMGQRDERNLLLRNFIITLNHDIEEFSSGEWDALRRDLNALRRSEHLSATGDDESQQLMTMDEHRDADPASDDQIAETQATEDQFGSAEVSGEGTPDSDRSRSNVEGFGTVESANDPKISTDDDMGIEYVSPEQEEQNSRDEGESDDDVVELTYESRDKAQSR